MNLLIVIGLILICSLLSWGVTVGIIKLITLCFGLEFSLLIATGIWLVLALVGSFFKSKQVIDMDLIDRKELVKWLKDVGDYLKSLENTKLDRKLVGKIIDHIEAMSTVEAEPVLHGKWIRQHMGDGWDDWDSLTCSECNFYIEKPQFVGNYCPNCGAKMDGD